ncbi:hypothetical protein P154DRAFT_564602 [Amniculicola lignicola CBS 123094]|uniref:Uncharacterized protein n=1 Tax=Amniculicola lignicola CBS 123094 TaxID=1392246 RepID=A0A6A5WB44_9PLEO|nr:hypothetical protein P154DRAFT_564602 [Amniculicola lignicola CBS 123094]
MYSHLVATLSPSPPPETNLSLGYSSLCASRQRGLSTIKDLTLRQAVQHIDIALISNFSQMTKKPLKYYVDTAIGSMLKMTFFSLDTLCSQSNTQVICQMQNLIMAFGAFLPAWMIPGRAHTTHTRFGLKEEGVNRPKFSLFVSVIWTPQLLQLRSHRKNIRMANDTGEIVEMHSEDTADYGLAATYLFLMEYDCSTVSATASKTVHVGFNSTGSGPKQWNLIESTNPESRKALGGMIIIDRGAWDQSSDIEVFVTVSSNDTANLEKLHIKTLHESLGIVYEYSDQNSLYTNIDIRVFLRPGPQAHLDVFDIKTRVLGVRFERKLGLEIDNLSIDTYWGGIDMNTSPWWDPLIVYNMSLSSIHGDISGYCITPENNLTVRNDDGETGIRLCPKIMISPKSPFDPKIIDVSSVSGMVVVEFFWSWWPAQAFSHRATIRSESGQVYGALPQGAYTNISSISGDLWVAIQPYNTNTEGFRSEIYTSTEEGDVDFKLVDSHKGSLEKYNPLLWLVSEHKAGKGLVQLRYPYSWYGEMEATVESGQLTFDGSELKKVERSEGYVKAVRGARAKAGESQMMTHVDEGELEICLGYNPELGILCEG